MLKHLAEHLTKVSAQSVVAAVVTATAKTGLELGLQKAAPGGFLGRNGMARRGQGQNLHKKAEVPIPGGHRGALAGPGSPAGCGAEMCPRGPVRPGRAGDQQTPAERDAGRQAGREHLPRRPWLSRPAAHPAPTLSGQESCSQAHICTNASLTAHSRAPAKRHYFKLPGLEHWWWEQTHPESSQFSKKGKGLGGQGGHIHRTFGPGQAPRPPPLGGRGAVKEREAGGSGGGLALREGGPRPPSHPTFRLEDPKLVFGAADRCWGLSCGAPTSAGAPSTASWRDPPVQGDGASLRMHIPLFKASLLLLKILNLFSFMIRQPPPHHAAGCSGRVQTSETVAGHLSSLPLLMWPHPFFQTSVSHSFLT